MPKSSFKFKQFTIFHDKCAMKVGTDGVLLGAWAPADKAKRILDVGTGTGLIALQLAQRNPHARITAIEIDAAAAGQATENVSHSPWADRVEIICHDFRDYQPENRFDLIVSNPPYIPTSVIEGLQEEVRLYDPFIALDGKEDGLYFYREIIKAGIRYLRPEGYLMFEIGYDQGNEVACLMEKQGYRNILVKKDLAGLDRVVSGMYNGE